MICYIKEIQGLLSTLTKKVLFFKALKNQWWISSTFKHFKDLYEPCKWISEFHQNNQPQPFEFEHNLRDCVYEDAEMWLHRNMYFLLTSIEKDQCNTLS